MKYILLLILLSPFFAKATYVDTMYLRQQHQVLVSMLNKLTDTNSLGILRKLNKQIIKQDTRTIYILRQPFTDSMPKKLNGYNIKLADAQKDIKMLYKNQSKHAAAIIYLNAPFYRGSKIELTVIPIHIKENELVYDTEGCTIVYSFNTKTFGFDFSEARYYH